ncbi:MAG TPA: non-homologous end-joining DNA ligase [Candidatus Dormibacteraeota bacterium]|nr:non-homologous end-joining DNA ligase [Candidatus Dormibacteraeota bacterium]
MSVPMPGLVDPMQALLADDVPTPEDRYGFEFKWDGIRAVCYWDGGQLRLQTRNRHDVTARYPELRPLGDALGARRQAVLDGEIVALDERGRPSFEELQKRMGLTSEADIRRQMRETPVAYLLFDVVYLNGNLLLDQAYTRRRRRLEALRLSDRHWQTPPSQVGHGHDLMRASTENGLEGVIAKRLDSAYEAGRRSGAWLKVKNRMRQEFVIGGWVDGEGRRAGLPGALLVGYWEGGRLVYASKVGTGFTDAALAHVAELLKPLERPTSPFDVGRPPGRPHFVEPRLVAEIEFSEWTRGGELRAPSFKGLRQDKDPRDVVRELPRHV